METRILHTSLWVDEYFTNLDVKEKLLFIYFISNERVNIINFYQLPTNRIKADTGIDSSFIDKTKAKFHKDKKIFFKDNYVFLVHGYKYQNYGGPQNEKKKEKLISQLSKDVLAWYNNIIDTGIDTSIDSSIDTNDKSIIINHKSIIHIDETKNNIINDLIIFYNQAMKSKFKTLSSNNLDYWLKIYTVDDIKKAIQFIPTNDFWKDKMDLTVLLRRRNPKGEDVDYIGQLLNTRKPTQQLKEGSSAFMERVTKWKQLQIIPTI